MDLIICRFNKISKESSKKSSNNRPSTKSVYIQQKLSPFSHRIHNTEDVKPLFLNHQNWSSINKVMDDDGIKIRRIYNCTIRATPYELFDDRMA